MTRKKKPQHFLKGDYNGQKEIIFEFNQECKEAFRKLISALIIAPIIQPPDWIISFEIMCDASDFMISTVLDQ